MPACWRRWACWARPTTPLCMPRPQPGEVAEVFSLPLSWLMAPENLDRIAITFGGRERHVFEYQRHQAAPDQRVWGATASILYNLRQRLLAAGGLP